MKTVDSDLRTRLLIWLFLIAAGLLLIIPSSRPAASVVKPQGKGGEVIAKPTPSPTPKKTTTKRTPARNRSAKPDAASAAAVVFWNSIKDSANPDDFKEYLKKYPNGEFAGLAKNKLKTLEPGAQPANPTASPASTNPGATNSSSPNSTSSKIAMPSNPPLPLHSFDFVTATLDGSGNLRNRDRKSAYAYTQDLGGGVNLEMVAIPPGEFMMGSPESEANHQNNEGPQHRVRINSWLYVGKFEITQAQWRAVMGTNPSSFKDCDECPVEQVSWDDAVEFCRKLSARTGREYRLPSEAEWEYAARGGTTTPFAFGDTVTPEIVNYNGNYPYANLAKGTYREKTVAAGSLGVANAFGLYDMHGNVWEWCRDWYHDSYSAISGDAPTDGSAWLTGGEQKDRVLRGGAWINYAVHSRSAFRSWLPPDLRLYSIGFRVVGVARTQ